MATSKSQQSVDIGTKLIGEFVNDNYTLRIEAHNSQIECRANITVHDTTNSIPPAELISILRNYEITTTVDLEQVAIFCTEAAQGEDPQQFVLAKGLAPVHGEDGWFELIVETGKEKTDLVEDESGRVDFKSIQNFSNVEPGQQIGTIYPPTVGEPGKSITGKVIPPTAGKPSQIIAGSGVRFSDDGIKAIAERDGRPVFDNNTLTVAEEFIVNGDVDLSIGNISFNGFVDIKGDVLDDFNITATKGINITGAVGNCQISSDGSVTIGTMAGMGTGKISCKGTLQARYLNQTIVECLRDVNISNELRNSIIKSAGSINISKGIVTGGELVALEGIEVKTLGTRTGTKTTITSGVYFPETDRLQYLRSQLKSLVDQIKRIGTTLTALNKKPLTAQRKALREAIELRIGILTQRQVNLDEEREEVADELLAFAVDEHPTANPKINVLGALKEGVTIKLGETSKEITTEISGPVSIIENPEMNGFRYLTYSPLNVSAENLEEEASLEDEVS
ncbi:MAG: FapA family protein [Thermodesulfobacteriota bacterium]|nr:FapA family protein [Thermodesulfobacteriota bacterium]